MHRRDEYGGTEQVDVSVSKYPLDFIQVLVSKAESA